MAHAISLKIRRPIEVVHTDIEIQVRHNNEKLGTVTLSRGSIDWRPKHAKTGKRKETHLTWSQFAELMEQANER